MKILCLMFVAIFLVNFSSAQYSYVYEIRHENKPQRNEGFGDMSQYKYNNPAEVQQTEANSRADPKTREFSVKAPEVGPHILNLMRSQMQEKSSESRIDPKESLWALVAPENNYNGQSPSLALQSNTDAPTYARQERQPQHKTYINANELPIYADKYRSMTDDRRPSIPKEYPIQEMRPQREEQKIYEQRPVFTTSYPSHSMESNAPNRPSRHQQQEKDEKMRTVHQIQTPNYRISLVSKPESLEKILPFLAQYQLSQKPFQSQDKSQSYSEQSIIPPHLTSMTDSMSGSMSDSRYQEPQRNSYRESGKPLMLSVEPDARIYEPSQRHTNELPELRPSPQPRPHPRYEERERSQSIRQFPVELKSIEHEPRPILDMPRQELPPQMALLNGRKITQLPPPEPRSYDRPMIENRPSYDRPVLESRPSFDRPMRQKLEPMPVTALYQMSAPDLKNAPQYSRVEYISEEQPKRGERQQSLQLKGEPVYRIVERGAPGKEVSLVDLSQELEKMDPTAQKMFFDRIKSQSTEMSDRSRTKYRNEEEKPMIATDPNYKPSPIPDEYKPFTQTRYYKTYV